MDQPKYDATFLHDDYFDRGSLGAGINDLIHSLNNTTSHKGALSISIDAPWGIGKTTFIYMLKNLIKETSYGWWTVYYDAWENDMSNDPFTSILFQICAQCERQAPSDKKKIIKQGINQIVSSAEGFSGVVPDPVVQATGKGISLLHALINPDGTDNISEHYEQYIEHKKSFHNNLATMAKNCNKIIVFVDELDRCKPTFAVQTLETIKHYFDIENIVFIFAIDGKQLRETIKHYYGLGFDSSSYLTRFFEYQLLMPTPTFSQLIKYSNMKLGTSFKAYDIMEKIFRYTNITPREVIYILSGVDYIEKHYPAVSASSVKDVIQVIVCLLLSLRYKKMSQYEYIMSDLPYIAPQEEPNEIHQIMKTISDYSSQTVNAVKKLHNTFVANTYYPTDETTIPIALKCLLHDSLKDQLIGDEITKILNIVAVPNAPVNN